MQADTSVALTSLSVHATGGACSASLCMFPSELCCLLIACCVSVCSSMLYVHQVYVACVCVHRVCIERVRACIECVSSVCVRASSVYRACAECASSVYLVLVQAAPMCKLLLLLCANYSVCKLLLCASCSCVLVTSAEPPSYRAAASITMCNV